MKSNTIVKILNDKNKFNIIAKSSFDLVDVDNSGYIDSIELKTVLSQLARDLGSDPPSDEDLQGILLQLDTDKSGRIEYNEFSVLIKDILECLVEDEDY